MILKQLYIAEESPAYPPSTENNPIDGDDQDSHDKEKDEENKGKERLRVGAGGAGKLILFLLSVIYHGVLGKKVAAGKMNSESAAKIADKARDARLAKTKASGELSQELWEQSIINKGKRSKLGEFIKRLSKHDENRADSYRKTIIDFEELTPKLSAEEAIEKEKSLLDKLLKEIVKDLKNANEV